MKVTKCLRSITNNDDVEIYSQSFVRGRYHISKVNYSHEYILPYVSDLLIITVYCNLKFLNDIIRVKITKRFFFVLGIEYYNFEL